MDVPFDGWRLRSGDRTRTTKEYYEVVWDLVDVSDVGREVLAKMSTLMPSVASHSKPACATWAWGVA